MLIEEGQNFTVETNKEFKNIINNFKNTKVSDINIDINLKKGCCYSETEFSGEYEGHNYTIKGKIHGKWFETEYWWDEDPSLKSFIETVGDVEITELDEQLSYGKLDTDVSSYEGDSIEWSDETPKDIVNKFKDDYDSLMYDNDDVDQDELLFYEPTNNISLIEISFKDSQDNQIKINWSNKNIT